jgi:serine/threonine protein kinase
VLGSPRSSDLEFVTKKEARDFVMKLPKKKAKPFNQLFPDANPVALDLLSKMLVFNPNKRATIEDCISHPYFKGLHDPGEEPLSDKHFDWSFDDIKLTKDNLQKMVYEESLFFHAD